MADEIVTRLCRKCGQLKDARFFYACRPRCLDCHRAINAAWRAANPDQAKTSTRNYYENNKANRLAYGAEYRTRFPEKRAAVCKSWNQRNKERRNENNKKSRQRHSDRVASNNAARWARQRSAIPVWADLTAIKGVYAAAREKTEQSGIRYVVDHIVPLISPIVCGLHCEANLQVITMAENTRKSNTWWPDMP